MSNVGIIPESWNGKNLMTSPRPEARCFRRPDTLPTLLRTAACHSEALSHQAAGSRLGTFTKPPLQFLPMTLRASSSRPARTRLAGFATIALTLALGTPSHAADWPQWRGPNRDDISAETGLLKDWSASPPKLLWLFKEAGLGYSGYSVAAGKLFTMGARDNVEHVIAVDVKTGKQLWATPVGDRFQNDWGDGPRGTPTVDGDRVYALGGQGTLVCVNVQDGQPVWKKTMQELGGSPPHWGYTESVLIEANKVICTPGGSQGTLAALNKTNGELIWQSKSITEPAQYSSVIAVNHNGGRQLVQLVMKKLFAVHPADGSLLWETDWPGATAVIPTPIFKDGHVYVTSGYGVGSKLARIDAGNKVTDVYANKVMKNHHGGVVLIGDHLYGYSDGPGWICQNFKTGEEVWANKSLGKGAVHAADGMLYCLDEGTGTIALVEASPKGWNEKGRFKLDPQTTQRKPRGKIWTHPVVADGKLFLRDQELLFCFDVKNK